MKVFESKDFWAGLMFIAFGLGFMIVAQNYAMGTAVRMGPAYFPTALGGLLAVLGLIILATSFVSRGEKVGRFYFKPLIMLLVAIVLFGVLLKPLGLVLSTVGLIFISALGGFEFRFKEVAVLYVVLVVFSVLVFVYGLGLPFNLWPGQ